jgi:hypothetical protein
MKFFACIALLVLPINASACGVCSQAVASAPFAVQPFAAPFAVQSFAAPFAVQSFAVPIAVQSFAVQSFAVPQFAAPIAVQRFSAGCGIRQNVRSRVGSRRNVFRIGIR